MKHPSPAVLATTTLLVVLAGVGCGGSKSGATTPSGNGTSNGDTSGGSSTEPGSGNDASAGTRLVAMVGEVATEVAGAGDCDAFAAALVTWTNRHRAEFEKLVAEIQAAAESGEATSDAERMDEQIVEGYLAVVEAAAECGDNEDAMAAYEAFNATVEKATY